MAQFGATAWPALIMISFPELKTTTIALAKQNGLSFQDSPLHISLNKGFSESDRDKQTIEGPAQTVSF